MDNNPNDITEQDRACINCKNLVRRWNLFALMDIWFDNGASHYRCAWNGKSEKIDPVTGKVTVKIETVPCNFRRKSRSDVCGPKGERWEPNERFLKNKKNLFKVLKDVTGEK